MSIIYLGVDWGRARVGVAVSDELGRMAHPLVTLKPSSLKELAHRLSDLAQQRKVSEVILGLPKHMNNTEGDSATVVRKLAALLQEVGLRVVLWDERLTSWQAQERLREGVSKKSVGASQKDRKQGRPDRAAATLLLQSFLDRRSGDTGAA